MLIISYKHVEERLERAEARGLFLYGQVNNPTMYALAEMNTILHKILDMRLEVGDTLERARFKERGYLKEFEVVVVTTHWNQRGYGEYRLKRAEFFPRGGLTSECHPHNSADRV